MQDIRIEAAETVSLFCRLNQRVKKELPIRSSEMGLLILLVTSEEPLSSVEAAQFFQVSKPVITAMVKSLTAKGYLGKEPQAQDKRSFLLVPEPKAVELVHSTCSEYLYTMTLLQEHMGREAFEEMIRLLAQANAVIQKEEDKKNG